MWSAYTFIHGNSCTDWLKCIFLQKKYVIAIQTAGMQSLIDSKSALVQVMAWYQTLRARDAYMRQ